MAQDRSSGASWSQGGYWVGEYDGDDAGGGGGGEAEAEVIDDALAEDGGGQGLVGEADNQVHYHQPAADDSDVESGGGVEEDAAPLSVQLRRECLHSKGQQARASVAALISACHHGNVLAVMSWLEGGACHVLDTWTKVRYLKKGLLMAVRSNYTQVVRVLLVSWQGQAYISQASVERAFLRACYSNYNHMVEMMLSKCGVNINCSNKKRETGLMLACKYGCNESIQVLLRCGAECNLQAHQGYSTLHYAIHSIYCDYPIITQLLNAGASCNLVNNRLETPLVLQIKLCMPDTPTAEALLSAMDKRYLDVLDDNGYNALQYACYYGDFDIAYRLIEEGSNPNYRARTGSTALHLLVHKYYCTGMHDQEQQNRQPLQGRSPEEQEAAMLAKMEQLFKVMIERGGHLDLVNANSHTAIDLLRGKHTVQPCVYCDRNRNLAARQAILRSVLPSKLSCLAANACAKYGIKYTDWLVTKPARYLITLHKKPLQK